MLYDFLFRLVIIPRLMPAKVAQRVKQGFRMILRVDGKFARLLLGGCPLILYRSRHTREPKEGRWFTQSA